MNRYLVTTLTLVMAGCSSTTKVAPSVYGKAAWENEQWRLELIEKGVQDRGQCPEGIQVASKQRLDGDALLKSYSEEKRIEMFGDYKGKLILRYQVVCIGHAVTEGSGGRIFVLIPENSGPNDLSNVKMDMSKLRVR